MSPRYRSPDTTGSMEFARTRVVIVGSINMDLVARCQRMPRSGETIHATDYATLPGGKGANQAVQAALLGAETHFVGKVGDDAYFGSSRPDLPSRPLVKVDVFRFEGGGVRGSTSTPRRPRVRRSVM